MEIKLGKSNSIIKKLKAEISQHNQANYFIIDDLSIIEMILKKEYKINSIFYCLEKINNPDTLTTLTKLKQKADHIYQISLSTYNLIASKNNSQGMIITLYKKIYTIDNIDLSKYPKILITDKLELPGNLGTLYRSAAATGFNLIINVDLITNINHYKTIHSSRGMVLTVDTLNATFAEVIKLFKENNIIPYLAEPKAGENIFTLKFKNKIPIVIGNERYGINKKWYDYNHYKIYIPMTEAIDSLNVSIAGSILMYQTLATDFDLGNN